MLVGDRGSERGERKKPIKAVRFRKWELNLAGGR